MYFQDLSSYVYHKDFVRPNMLNIGWLEKSHPFPKGDTSEEFKDCLFRLCQNEKNIMRGFYTCPFCENAPHQLMKVFRKGENAYLGHGEAHAIDNNKIYSAPTLIYHYVVDHNYHPPDEYIHAVIHTARNLSQISKHKKQAMPMTIGPSVHKSKLVPAGFIMFLCGWLFMSIYRPLAVSVELKLLQALIFLFSDVARACVILGLTLFLLGLNRNRKAKAKARISSGSSPDY